MQNKTPHKIIKPSQNNRGVALLLALFSVMILTFVAVEISYETTADYLITSKGFSRLKAYYAAKSGVELSLLRIQLFTNISGQYGEELKGNEAIIEKIWNFPFI